MGDIRLDATTYRVQWYVAEEFQTPVSNRGRSINRPRAWRPLTDVYETDAVFVVRVEVGGMKEKDFSVVLEGQHLLISGVRGDVQERRAYHQLEIPVGEFSIEVDLPQPVHAELVQASYRDGFLRIILPKLNREDF